MSRRITPITRRVTDEPISAPPNLTMKEQQQHQTFPYKLYEMLEYACDSEFSSSLSWSADGSCFIIHDKEVMMDDLAPMFFKQTKFRSFTRQLNIWGFVRSDTLGGQKGSWQHKDFLRGRPDLLTEIERTEVKSAVKKMSSVIKSKAKEVPSNASRSSRRVSISDISNGVAADESSCSSSTIDTQASRAFPHVTVMPSVASASAPLVLPNSQVQGTVFQYFSDYGEQNTVSTSSSSSVQSFNDDPPTIDNGSNAQPFNDEDLMYLASIFNEDEQHSNEDDLCSFLSLNQETSAGDFMFGL
jgi:hypothetical protein